MVSCGAMAPENVDRGWARVNISFTPEQHEALRRHAFEHRTTIAATVRDLVEGWRARQPQQELKIGGR
jgi:hypothetical protein